MVKKNLIAEAIKHPGALHQMLNVPDGNKIPETTLRKAATSKGKLISGLMKKRFIVLFLLLGFSARAASLITAGSMSGNLISSAFDMTFVDEAALQAVYTGSPVGTLILMVSNDDTTYTDLTGSGSAITVAGSVMYGISNIGYPFLKIQYRRTSGSGTLDATIRYKERRR